MVLVVESLVLLVAVGLYGIIGESNIINNVYDRISVDIYVSKVSGLTELTYGNIMLTKR